MNLDKARNEIDQIDQVLVAALEKRMSLVDEIVLYKQQNGLPVLDASRETALLNKVESYVTTDKYKKSIRDSFQDILKISRAYQENLLNK